jgi:aminoglycoside phosphotransferase (APT) family kinase protein
MMLHGDLHPGNILLADDGSLAGVIDFGDVGAGDRLLILRCGG